MRRPRGHDLTAPQLRLLRGAIAFCHGEVSTHGLDHRTREALTEKGYISTELQTREPAARATLEAQGIAYVAQAQALIATDWQGALTALEAARRCQMKLEMKVLRVTDKARALVAAVDAATTVAVCEEVGSEVEHG